MNREALIKSLSLISPALSSSDHIPVMKHFWFMDDCVMAFNDQIAISTTIETPIEGALPGKILLNMLNRITSEEVSFESIDEWCVIKYGKNKTLKLSMLPKSAFLFTIPEIKKDHLSKEEIVSLIQGIECCLYSVSDNANAPDMGITAVIKEGLITLYSTDDQTMARAKIKTAQKWEDKILLATPFCKQLIAFKNRIEKFNYQKDGVTTELDDGTKFYGRLLHNDNPINYEKIFSQHLGSVRTIEIDKNLSEVINRACVLTAIQRDKVTQITVKNNVATIQSDADTANFNEVIKLVHPDVTVTCNPELLKFGFGKFTRWLMTPNCIIMAKDNLRYLISTK